MKISIPKPCNENWNDMTPEQQGAFCKVCSKVVVDFSSMSDEEVLNYFERKKGEKTCGRFRASQLSPYEMKINLQEVAKSAGFRKIFAASLFIIFSSLFVCKSDTGQPLQFSTVITGIADTASVLLQVDTLKNPKEITTELRGEVAVEEPAVMGKPAMPDIVDTNQITRDTTIEVQPIIMGLVAPVREPMIKGKIKCTPERKAHTEQSRKKEPTVKGEPMILGGPFYSK
ncbi:MAG: hypothetical protein KA149_09190 [Chitinophagales bacterium]|nr:hypothetical protein [Chitinophagales bacterium]